MRLRNQPPVAREARSIAVTCNPRTCDHALRVRSRKERAEGQTATRQESAVRVQELSQHVRLGIDERFGRTRSRLRMHPDLLELRLEIPVHRRRQRALNPHEYERAHRREHDAHHKCGREREAQSNRQSTHGSSERSRYPTPRTVSSR